MSLENTPILNKNQIIESINDKISNGLNVIKNSPINIIKNTIKKNENINKAAKIINAQSVKITGEVPTEEDVVDDITTSTNSTNNFTNSTETTTEKQPKAKETYQGMAIADVFTKYGVTKQEINDAMMPLRFKNPDLANELTSYFKAGAVNSVQWFLGIRGQEYDGKFGPKTLKKLQEAGGFNTDTALDNITKTPDTLDSFKNERAVVEAEYKRINENTKMGSYVKKLEIDKLTKKLEDIQTRYLANTRIDKKPGFEIGIKKEISAYKEKSDEYMRKYIFERITNFTTKATPEIQTPTQARINTLKKETEELPKIITLLNKNKNLYKNSDDFNKLLNVVTAQNKNNKAEIAYLNAKLSNINAINDIKKQYVKEKREQRITGLKNNLEVYKTYYINYLGATKGNQDFGSVNAEYIN